MSVTSQGEGTVTASREYFYYGDDVTLYVQPATGYRLSKLTVCGEEVTVTDKSYVISGKAENIVVVAEFEKEVYSVVLAHGEGGNLYSDKKTYSVGESVTVTFAPDKGYRTKLVGINGTFYEKPGDSFVIPEYTTGDVTVYAEFEIITYKLTLECSGNGKAELSAELKELIVEMQRTFGTKVNAIGNDKKGRIYIDYYTRDDLDRLSEIVEFLRASGKIF